MPAESRQRRIEFSVVRNPRKVRRPLHRDDDNVNAAPPVEKKRPRIHGSTAPRCLPDVAKTQDCRVCLGLSSSSNDNCVSVTLGLPLVPWDSWTPSTPSSPEPTVVPDQVMITPPSSDPTAAPDQVMITPPSSDPMAAPDQKTITPPSPDPTAAPDAPDAPDQKMITPPSPEPTALDHEVVVVDDDEYGLERFPVLTSFDCSIIDDICYKLATPEEREREWFKYAKLRDYYRQEEVARIRYTAAASNARTCEGVVTRARNRLAEYEARKAVAADIGVGIYEPSIVQAETQLTNAVSCLEYGKAMADKLADEAAAAKDRRLSHYRLIAAEDI
jgi:hypothetical protein